MTQEDFARELRIGTRTLQKYEADKAVPDANVVALAALTANCPLETLYSFAQYEDTPPV